MPTIVKKDNADLTSELTITFAVEDYEPKLKSELSKYRQQTQLKGFRKGKGSMDIIKKRFGKDILTNILNGMLQDELNNYLKKVELNLLGQPLPSKDQAPLDINLSKLANFVFKLDMGIAPEFELIGLSKENVVDRYATVISDAMISDELKRAQKQLGNYDTNVEDIQEDDIIRVNSEELEGDSVKEKGWASSFSIPVNRIASDELKEEIKNKQKGDKFRFDIYLLEKDTSEEFVRKNLLQIGENDDPDTIGNLFEGTIEEVKRLIPATPNQEFYDRLFGEGNITSLEEAENEIGKRILPYYDRQADKLCHQAIKKDLLEKNPLALPDEFMKRWLKATNAKITDDLLDKDYPDYAEEIKWSLIKNVIIRKFGLFVTEEEILEQFKISIRNYWGGNANEYVVLNTANKMMENKEQVESVRNELISGKMFERIKEELSIRDTSISSEEFDNVLAAHKESRAKKEETENTEEPVMEENAEQEETVEDNAAL